MIQLNDNTPVESYKVLGHQILVKRDDLAAPLPGPPFSKVRGLVPHLEMLKELGYKNIGYVETSISLAGWGVAWACHHLGLHCIIFDPQYVKTPGILLYHRRQWKKFGAEIRPIPAGMAKINWNIAAHDMKGEHDVLLPLGLPLHETIHATAGIAHKTQLERYFKSVVVCVGSGTICAGILLGMTSDIAIHGVMSRTGNRIYKLENIYDKAGLIRGGLLGRNNLELHDPGWEYTQRSRAKAPFPSHNWYDLKAFQWLTENIEKLTPPVLFWNIGRVR